MNYLSDISLSKLITLIKTEIKNNSGGGGDGTAVDPFVEFEVTIPANWTGEAAPYTQEITVEGILARDEPFADLALSDDYVTSQSQIEDWAKIYKIVTTNGAITVYANKPTTIPLTIQLIAIRNALEVEAIEGDMITSKSITRTKLANDALYSPMRFKNGSVDITIDDIGGTVFAAWDTAATFTLSQANSTAFPIGAEIAVFRNGVSENAVLVTGDGVRFAITGENALKKNASVKIADTLGMIALKKTASDVTNGDAWLVTGSVEVVE